MRAGPAAQSLALCRFLALCSNAWNVAASSCLVRPASGHERAACARPIAAVFAAGGRGRAVPGLRAGLSPDAVALASHWRAAHCHLRPVHGNLCRAGSGCAGNGVGPRPVAPLRATGALRPAGGARATRDGLGRAACGAVAERAAEPGPHGSSVRGRSGELRDGSASPPRGAEARGRRCENVFRLKKALVMFRRLLSEAFALNRPWGMHGMSLALHPLVACVFLFALPCSSKPAMLMTSRQQSVLVGAAVTGILSTSYLGFINTLCCLGVIIGGAVATQQPAPLHISESTRQAEKS